MNREEMRQALIDSAVHTVATYGIHHATTKELATGAGLNEVYIYRVFKGKEDLLRSTFTYLDERLIGHIIHSFDRWEKDGPDVKENFRHIVHDVWRVLLDNRERCLYFIRYYYSQHYGDYSEAYRKAAYAHFLEMAKPYFEEGVDVWEEINRIYDIVFPTALRVIRGELPDTPETEDRVYEAIATAENFKICWDYWEKIT